MKKISEATKGKAMVLGAIPSLAFTLTGMLCISVDAATGINSAWFGMLCLCLGLTWFVVGISVFTVFEYWPQDDC